VTTVQRWSGREVRALRHATRMSLREFAQHLGVSHRMVSKWEAGGARIQPRPVNQSALDTRLARATPDADRPPPRRTRRRLEPSGATGSAG
jgi:transcriptional regulator with XRE-family HTH domain